MKSEVRRGSVVRLGREARGNGTLEGCMMVVTVAKAWGAEGYILIPRGVNESPSRFEYKAQWKEFTLVGQTLPQHV